MTETILQPIWRALFAGAAAALLLTTPAVADVASYSVTINTPDLYNSAGCTNVGGCALDFQFNPGGSSQLAYATISNFSIPNGSLVVDSADPSLTGDVTGALPGLVTFDNLSPYNDYFQGFLLGTAISFVVTLSGPAIDRPNGGTFGSTFGFALDSTSGYGLYTDDGFVATVDLNGDGSTTPTWLVDPSQGAVIPGVPEPSQYVVLGLGLLTLGFAAIRKRRLLP
jgi:hypothetical protein